MSPRSGRRQRGQTSCPRGRAGTHTPASPSPQLSAVRHIPAAKGGLPRWSFPLKRNGRCYPQSQCRPLRSHPSGQQGYSECCDKAQEHKGRGDFTSVVQGRTNTPRKIRDGVRVSWGSSRLSKGHCLRHLCARPGPSPPTWSTFALSLPPNPSITLRPKMRFSLVLLDQRSPSPDQQESSWGHDALTSL